MTRFSSNILIAWPLLGLFLIMAGCRPISDMPHEEENSRAATTQEIQAELDVTAELFRMAIVNDDSLAAVNIMLPTIAILEGGKVESREAYLSHHFHSDSGFLSAMERELLDRKYGITENGAWISTLSSLKGTPGDSEVNVTSAELLVLERTEGKWMVAAVHWSSRRN